VTDARGFQCGLSKGCRGGCCPSATIAGAAGRDLGVASITALYKLLAEKEGRTVGVMLF